MTAMTQKKYWKYDQYLKDLYKALNHIQQTVDRKLEGDLYKKYKKWISQSHNVYKKQQSTTSKPKPPPLKDLKEGKIIKPPKLRDTRMKTSNTRMKIYLNAEKCTNCHEIILSLNRHDYQTCSCGNIAVDGGRDYLRRAFKKDFKKETDQDFAKFVDQINAAYDKKQKYYKVPE